MLTIKRVFAPNKSCENCNRKEKGDLYPVLTLKTADGSIDLVRLCRKCLRDLAEIILKEIKRKVKKSEAKRVTSAYNQSNDEEHPY